MKWFLLPMTFTLMACGNDIEDSKKAVELEKFETHKLAFEDSIFIQEKIEVLNAEYFEGRQNDFGGWQFEDADVRLFKEVNFKVFNFLGEYIGAYGSPMYANYIIDLNRKDTLFLEDTSALLTCERVIKLDDNNYLILSKGPIRARGLEYWTCEEATIYNDISMSIQRLDFVKLSMLIENSDGNDHFIKKEANLINFKAPNTVLTSSYDYEWGTEWTDSMHCIKIEKRYDIVAGKPRLTNSDTIREIRKSLMNE